MPGLNLDSLQQEYHDWVREKQGKKAKNAYDNPCFFSHLRRGN
jgi:hypothetical protein